MTTARQQEDARALQDLAAWVAEGLLPEMNPTRQERSLKTALALIRAGRELLRHRSLEDLSIEMLCEKAGTTVGAFYGRFESKQQFFLTMQRVQTMRSQVSVRAFATRHAAQASTLDELCLEMVDETVHNFRTNLGVLRASLQHTKEGMWRVFKESGDRYRATLVQHMAPHLDFLPPAERKLRVLFAYQALAGVLVHACLNNPGPLALEDEALNGELLRLVKSYLLAPR